MTAENKPLVGVNLFITGKDYEDFDVDAVTKSIGLLPTKTQKQQVLDNGTKKPTYWLLSMKKTQELCIEDKIKELKRSLHGKEDIIYKFTKQNGLCVGLEVNIESKSDNLPEVFFSQEILTFACSINATVGVGLYLD